MANKATDKEDPKLGAVQADQQGAATDPELDTPSQPNPSTPAEEQNQPESEAPHDAGDPVPEQDLQEEENPDASHKPGEAMGRKTEEQKAAEEAPNQVAPGVMDPETNPVAQATENESKDPYAEGKHIANPEPNNGKGEDPEKWDREQEKKDAKAVQESVAKTEQNEADQNAAEAKADKAAEKAAK